MKTNNYFIDGESGSYRTLNEIRLHIWMQSESDKQAYNGMQIFRENDDKFFRTIDIRKNGKIVFIK